MDKVAIYCRLSKEDEIKIKQGDDSESIQNQKTLLREYAMEHNMQIYKIYSDDDFSGADKNRPEWSKMLHDAENRRFSVVLCKTQSRFTRELEIVEKYIHGLFLEWGIRFIGVVDHVDTNVKGNKKARQISGLVNEWYLEDTSENIKSVFRQKMKEGKFLGSFSCYGYKRQEKYKLAIDEEAAKVVRKIFDLYLQGYSIRQISGILTEEKILTPTQYKQSIGLAYQNSNSDFSTTYGIWSTNTIKRILKNKVYIGYLIQGREKKISYKSKKIVLAPEEEWIVIKNSHEPIVEETIFFQVQNLMKAKRTVCYYKGKRKAHCLAGKVKCRDCGAAMIKSGGGEKGYLRCQLANKTRGAECTTHSIRLDLLIEQVGLEIKQLIDDIPPRDWRTEVVQNESIELQRRTTGINQSRKNIEIQMQDVKKAMSTLYIDKTKGLFSEEEFLDMKQSLKQELIQLEKEWKETEEKIKNFSLEVNQKGNEKEGIETYIDFKNLSNEIVADFIDHIEVGEKDCYGNREIEIYWNI
ncbi:recombinase family protein [Anaeromicropila populeti]|uniref:Site-specific DNA recombinase n=1 Tax=Anaeromicropila populeti TaxID=37658 RepID=A0A1I6HIU3_9FIRM|nr:recombinase family protein [Anaeromicropila populeti]SFR54326.1 Site-specific DNA recombinase [Anaeromicropila populeti]